MLKEYDFQQREVVQLAASRSKEIGRYHLMMGENPDLYYYLSESENAKVIFYMRSKQEGNDVLKTIPRIMLAAGASGSGKTLLTCGLLQVLVNRRIKTVSFKCGPDYIDPNVPHPGHWNQIPESGYLFHGGRDHQISSCQKQCRL